MLSTEISVTLFREPKRAGTHAGHLAAAWQTWRQASPADKGTDDNDRKGVRSYANPSLTDLEHH